MAFKKGVSGNPKGRPRSGTSLSNLQVRDFLERLLNDKRYWPNLRRRFNAGKAQHLEVYLWQMKFGKAPQKIEVTRKNYADDSLARVMTKQERIVMYTILKKARARLAAGPQIIDVSPSGKVLALERTGDRTVQSASPEQPS